MKTKRAGKRRSTQQDKAPAELTAPVRQRSYRIFIAVACLLFAAIVAIAARSKDRRTKDKLVAETPEQLPSLGDLCLMSSEDLAKQDIALINLRCAEGLPGSENLDVARCLKILDQWAEQVKRETDIRILQFYKEPEQYDNSEAHFRMMALVTIVQQDYGVKYNPNRVAEVSEADFDYTNSQDLFIHGLITSDNGGTCVSMPVLYTAIAQRLGYPVHLVHAKAHVFCRWDGRGERVNVEATNQGMNAFDDDHYMQWPHRIVKVEVDRGLYLKSLDNDEAFAGFLASRGNCLEDNGELPDARVSYVLASKHAPENPVYRAFLNKITRPKSIRDYPALARQQQRLVEQRRRDRLSVDAYGRPVTGDFNPANSSFGFQNQASIPNGFDAGFQP